MAKGLGFVDKQRASPFGVPREAPPVEPQRTSPVDPKATYTGPIIDPVNPEGNPNVRRRPGPQLSQKYTPRRSMYQWMSQNNQLDGSYGSVGYGTRRRGKKNNDSGSTPGAYTDFIER